MHWFNVETSFVDKLYSNPDIKKTTRDINMRYFITFLIVPIGFVLFVLTGCAAKMPQPLPNITEGTQSDDRSSTDTTAPPINDQPGTVTDKTGSTDNRLPPTTDRREPPSFEIRLRSRTFTPKPGISRRLTSTKAERRDSHIILQLQKPANREIDRQLRAQGVTLVSSINRVTYFAVVTPDARQHLAKISELRWADVISTIDKLDPVMTGRKPQSYQMVRDGIAYHVLFHADVTADQVRALANNIGATLSQFNVSTFSQLQTAIVVISENKLKAFAEADAVQWIEPAPPPVEDHNQDTTQYYSFVDRVQAPPSGLNGQGVTVGVWEAKGVIDGTHQDLLGRVALQDTLNLPVDSHATGVAGTLGGSGANSQRAEGMAPAVEMLSFDWVNDVSEMIIAATPATPATPTNLQQRMLISNHSYGASIGWGPGPNPTDPSVFTNNRNLFGLYTIDSRNFDLVSRNMLLNVVVSAGNHRTAQPDPNQVIPNVPGAQLRDCVTSFSPSGLDFGHDGLCTGPRATAKNVITVGAMNARPAVGGVIGPQTRAPNGQVADFSSFGPTRDGRIKPDLVANGQNVFTLLPNNQTPLTLIAGTSFAAPAVSGIIALLLQKANDENVDLSPLGVLMPPAVKALLIQTAEDVAGLPRATIGPDYATGWGVVNAEAAVDLLRQEGFEQGVGVLDAAGGGLGGPPAWLWTKNFTVPANRDQIKFTLAWSDPAGSPNDPVSLIHDLDLVVIDPDGEKHDPWRLNPSNPIQPATRSAGPDRRNNVEQVVVDNPAPGTWQVRVKQPEQWWYLPPVALANNDAPVGDFAVNPNIALFAVAFDPNLLP